MTTDRGVEDRADSHVPIADLLAPVEGEDVLLYGPAMSGKAEMGLELLVATVAETGGRPFYVSTAEAAPEARARLDARTPEGLDVAWPGVVGCAGGRQRGDEFTRTVGTPGDLTGIAAVLSGMFDNSRRSDRLGSCVLLDSVTELLVAADLEPVCKLLHVLSAKVEATGGTTVATLDTDGLTGPDRPALTGLFDTVVRVRRHEGRSQYRLHTDDDWHGYLLPEDP